MTRSTVGDNHCFAAPDEGGGSAPPDARGSGQPYELRGEADCIVIGAGMAGLTAAIALQQAGRSVLVLDKGRGVGGRMATRRVGGGAVDHGAQLVVAWGQAFRGQLHSWRQHGWLSSWPITQSVPDFPAPIDQLASIPLRPVGGMSRLPKGLAERLDVRLESKVVAISCEGDRWRVLSDRGFAYEGRALLLTAPVPQSLKLLADNAATLGSIDEALVARLHRVEYERCLTVIARLASPSRIPFPGLWVQRDHKSPARLVVDHLLKGTSDRDSLITIHSSHHYAEEHWDGDHGEIARELFGAVSEAIDAPMIESHVHRWRYSRPKRAPLTRDPSASEGALHEDDLPEFGILAQGPPLAMAGDGFGQRLIETAWQSGKAAGDWLGARLAGVDRRVTPRASH
jgi:predicted NAD/FAD-dependent oxidoreductase